VQSLIAACSGGFSQVQSVAQVALLSGYSIAQLTDQILNFILQDTHLSDLKKSEILLRLGEMDKKLTDGADEHLQLLDVLSFVYSRINA
jgi:replication factor C subunit 2/4